MNIIVNISNESNVYTSAFLRHNFSFFFLWTNVFTKVIMQPPRRGPPQGVRRPRGRRSPGRRGEGPDVGPKSSALSFLGAQFRLLGGAAWRAEVGGRRRLVQMRSAGGRGDQPRLPWPRGGGGGARPPLPAQRGCLTGSWSRALPPGKEPWASPAVYVVPPPHIREASLLPSSS